MASQPHQSLPAQNRQWADLKAAYRFLNNPRIESTRISQTHRRLTQLACRQHPVVLCIQDDSDLCATHIDSNEHLMHHTLAVLPDGRLLGMLEQRFFPRVKQPAGETRKQRASRWRESDVWQESVQNLGPVSPGCQFIHVADRAADNIRFMHACQQQGCGFVVRAHQDRRVNEAADKLWSCMQQQPVVSTIRATVGKQTGDANRPARTGRQAKLSVRYGPVRLDPPSNCHEVHDGPLAVHAVYLREENPSAGNEPVQWMLLSNLPMTCLSDALSVVSHYRKRWVIEEWHRALKEGCRLECSQLTQACALYRLTAMLSVVAVRLIQLRDLADSSVYGDDAMMCEANVDKQAIHMVAAWADVEPEELTARLFWRTLACRGGWIGRKSDGRPGWKTIWRGWHELQMILQAVNLLNQKTTSRETRGCG